MLGTILIAGKNLLRNKQRSFFCLMTIFIIAMMMSFFAAILSGMLNDLKSDIIRYHTGEAYIEHPDKQRFHRLSGLNWNIDPRLAEQALKAGSLVQAEYNLPQLDIQAQAFPSRGRGTVVSNPKTYGLSLKGRDLAAEERLNGLGKKLLEGSLPRSQNSQQRSLPALISKDLADLMGLELGSKFTIFAESSSVSQVFFTLEVSGILDSTASSLKLSAWMDIEQLADILGMPGRALRLQLYFPKEMKMQDDDKKLASWLGQANSSLAQTAEPLQAFSWKQDSALYQQLETSSAAMTFYTVFFFLLSGLILLNAVIIMLYERKRELGTLMALGYTRSALVRHILAEQFIISVLGSLLGVLASFILANILMKLYGGVPLGAAMQDSGFSISETTPLFYSFQSNIIIVLAAIIISMLLSLWPVRSFTRRPIVQLLYNK